MLQPIIKNSYLVEVNLTTLTTGQRYNFLDVPTLRAPYIFVQGIEAYTKDQITKSPNGATAVSALGAAGIVCTFTVRETEEVYQIPYFTLIAAQNAGMIREFFNKQINLTKSYITVLDATNLTAGESAIFNFYYVINKDGK